jgi:NAD(P)-dependent dehydrogenase (short-subunit alcohol dehydrogenase family)
VAVTGPEDRPLASQAAVVTGAAQGIGERIATRFAAAGAAVTLVDREGDLLDAAVGRLTGAGHVAYGVTAELGRAAEAARAIAEAVEASGRLDILVNCAGGSAHTSLHIEEVSEDDFDRVLSWNLKSAFFCIQAAIPHFERQGGGVVVNIGAISGRAGTDLLPPQYSAAKAGVIGLTRNLACHLGPRNIRVNVVAPGFIRSGPRVEVLWNSRPNPEEVLGQIPMRRRGTVDEVAESVLFCASPASGYITGAVIDVNGGFFCV